MHRLALRICLLVVALALGGCLLVALPGAAAASGPDRATTPPAAAPHDPPPRPVVRPESPLGIRAARLARRYLGVPYRWGGASPAGFDCSGLVMFVYGRLGVELPHNAAALYDVGREVAISDLQPGDLVFFDGLGHVGLALGGGRYIHAPQSGRSVEIDALADRAGSIVGARRVAADA